MRKYLVILLSFLILFPSCGSMFVYFSFKINQDKIARTICVQRKLVFNSCNGRCELQKSIKKYADNEKEMQDTLKEKSELVYIDNGPTAELLLISFTEPKNAAFTELKEKPVSVCSATFRPPSCFI
ncbi:hypothetical protein [Flavobacterium pectinovorum]|uniref:hypothetical protein n=1 Tax=Flavobacterium pectinovorum TaxID=29533 RepID=UPI001FAE5DAE|nr:hypothetical protein [Flavobacterium pectinovorum]